MADISRVADGLARTVPEYWADSYKAQLQSSIIRAVPDQKRYWYVVLDRTIFHPKGGGQPSDRGTLNGDGFKLEIKKAMLAGEDVVVHWGKAVEGVPGEGPANSRLDWDWRYLMMRRHSAAHLLDHCVEEVLGADIETVDSWLSNPCYVAYKGQPPPPEKMVEIQEVENRIISKGASVRWEDVEAKQLKREPTATPNYARLPRRGKLRLVTIEGCKPIACGGTHLRNLSEALGVRVEKIQPIDGGYRMHFDLLQGREPSTLIGTGLGT